MSASDHLQPRQFFHGTRYEMGVGDELTAENARRADPGYPPHIRHVWATTKPLIAATHATKSGPQYWDSGHVYQVEPIHPDDVEIDPLDNGSKTSFRSPTGFRVTQDLGSPAKLWDR